MERNSLWVTSMSMMGKDVYYLLSYMPVGSARYLLLTSKKIIRNKMDSESHRHSLMNFIILNCIPYILCNVFQYYQILFG